MAQSRKRGVHVLTGHGRAVVITGASRGLGFASAIELYRRGWTVVGAMRSPDVGLEAIRAATGATADDPRLMGVPLDLVDLESVSTAAAEILDAVGPPYALIHNAGIAAAGFGEETPPAAWIGCSRRTSWARSP